MTITGGWVAFAWVRGAFQGAWIDPAALADSIVKEPLRQASHRFSDIGRGHSDAASRRRRPQRGRNSPQARGGATISQVVGRAPARRRYCDPAGTWTCTRDRSART